MANTEPESIFDFMSKKFLQDKNTLNDGLKEHLTLFEVTDQYKNEIINKFNSKITKIYDTNIDNNTVGNFVSKVAGKSNLVFFIKFKDGRKEEDEEEVEVEYEGEEVEETLTQLVYLNGKVQIINKIISFLNIDVFSYGNYQSHEKDKYIYTSFKSQNSDIFVKFKIDCIYVMLYRNNYEVKFALKIEHNFKENPIISLRCYEFQNDFEFIIENKEKIDELFEKYAKKGSFKKVYLDELLFYKIED